MVQPHPAPFSKPIIDRLREILQGEEQRIRAVDPFGGTARLLAAMPPNSDTTIIEIERVFVNEGIEWLDQNGVSSTTDWRRLTNGALYEYICDDSRAVFRRRRKKYTHIITSPSYGNRLQDKHNPTPGRECRSYGQSVGGPLQGGNGAAFHFWHDEYWEIHVGVMEAAINRLEDDGVVILNLSDFFWTPAKKKGEPKKPTERAPVVNRWIAEMQDLGMALLAAEPIYTRRFKYGANRHRTKHEMLLTFERAT